MRIPAGKIVSLASTLAALARKSKPGIFIVVLAVVATSCMVGPNYTTPKANVASAWMPNPAITNRPFSDAEIYWWRNFNDPVLDQLVATACSNNLSLQIAGVRILETRARLNRSIGNLFPQQQGISGQVNYSQLNDNLLNRIPGVNSDYVSDQILFGATWEIDFWGKYRRLIQSDRANYLGTIADYDDAMITLIADVASTYVNIRTLEERIRVANQNLTTQKEGLRIATAQFQAGETSERDVQQATTRLAQTEAQIPLLNASLAQNRNGLAVLLGETPEEIDKHLTEPGTIPTTPTDVAAGIPKDLLRRRPDVLAAGLQAASYSALIGVAKAQMYPAFSLSGEFGFSGNNQFNNNLSDMFNWENRVVNAGAGVVFPIFNYGRLVNQVRVQDAQFEQALLNYQNTVLTAQQEVENGLANFANQQDALVSFSQAAKAARRSTDLAMIQYKEGQTDFTTVLTAEQEQLNVENDVAVTRGNVVQGLISVYRALGGGWQIRDGHDVISDRVKAEMAQRTDWGKMLEPSHHLPAAKVTAADDTRRDTTNSK
ncbi:MAG TPA: efflux transporter outer membrane subunit [Verrucomicrobiae bacterium]|nr:efflux transporter outer membrane subunit [Verrucomicrobiae bacterium]